MDTDREVWIRAQMDTCQWVDASVDGQIDVWIPDIKNKDGYMDEWVMDDRKEVLMHEWVRANRSLVTGMDRWKDGWLDRWSILFP